MTQNNLGNAYRDLPGGTGHRTWSRPSLLYRRAAVYTRDAFPIDWAMTQNNLGMLTATGSRDRAQNLEQAIAAYTAALDIYTRDAFPIQWAMTQNNLGQLTATGSRGTSIEPGAGHRCLYRGVGGAHPGCLPHPMGHDPEQPRGHLRRPDRGDRAQNLEQAIAAYTAALDIYTRDAFPIDWAMTQNNLGVTYGDRIAGDRAQNLEQAIAAYTAALDIYTRDAFPIDWAMTQNNLGVTYGDRIAGDRAQNLEQAIAAYTAALEVRTRDAFPIDYRDTQLNLA